jgi:uncharacterized protein (TIGR03435 family)
MSSTVNNSRGQMSANSVQISRLVNFLSQRLRRTVIDKTDLKAVYDLHLEWTPESSTLNAAAPTSGIAPAPTVPAEPSGPSLFTALQEQLGLKLESAKGPVEVLIIDSVQKPSEN